MHLKMNTLVFVDESSVSYLKSTNPNPNPFLFDEKTGTDM